MRGRVLAAAVLVFATLELRVAIEAESRALGAGGAFHAEVNVAVGVVPRTKLKRRVDAVAARVVRDHDRVIDEAFLLLLAEPRDRLNSLFLLEFLFFRVESGLFPAVELAVERELERAQHARFVDAGGNENGAVLGRGDVPLDALKDHELTFIARLADEAVRLPHATLVGVAPVRVLGEGDDIHAELFGLVHDHFHRVLRVVAVERVHVVVNDEPFKTGLGRREVRAFGRVGGGHGGFFGDSGAGGCGRGGTEGAGGNAAAEHGASARGERGGLGGAKLGHGESFSQGVGKTNQNARGRK